MRISIPLGIFYFFTILNTDLYGANASKINPVVSGISKVCFIENKGQILDENGKARTDIKYVVSSSSMNCFLTNKGITYLWRGQDTLKNPIDKTTKILYKTYFTDMALIGANPTPSIRTEDPNPDYSNYLGAKYGQAGITNVRSYNKIVYGNIYKNIDLVFYVYDKEKIKYDFIVKPGGLISDIKYSYNGQSNPNLPQSGSMIIENPFGSLTEGTPFTYQNTVSKQIPTKFSVMNGVISFVVGDYDKGDTLVIDPTVEWATYYGGNSTDQGENGCTDGLGNAYLAGRTMSTTNIAMNGYDNTESSSTPGNNYDYFLAKFSSSGSLLWATYYGTIYNEVSCDVATDPSNNVYLTGSLYSTSTGNDILLVKFNSSGSRQWEQITVGNDYDASRGICIDASANVYIAGFTLSTNIATSGTYQTTNAGNVDGFFAKYNSSGTLQWCSYYGGPSYEEILDICMDPSGYFYLGGQTSSTSAIASGGYQTTYGGGSTDAFLAKFNASGSMQWSTYYGGSGADGGSTNSPPYGMSVCTDASSNVYIGSTTTSTSNIASSGAYQTSMGSTNGSDDAFIVKFNSSGSRLWATYYGGASIDDALNIATDPLSNVYLSGATISTTGIASGGVQNTLAGSADAFLVKFNSSGSRIWGTYYGGTGDDSGDILFVSNNGGVVYLGGSTTSTSGIATSGAYQTTKNTDYDAFLVQFASEGYILTGTLSNNTICAGGYTYVPYSLANTVTFNSDNVFTVQLSDSLGSFANPLNIGTSGSTATSGSVYAFLPNNLLAGTKYRMRVVSSDPSSIGTDNGSNITVTRTQEISVTYQSPQFYLICGGTGEIDFSICGEMNAGNYYTAQLSDASGSFASYTTISSPLYGTTGGIIDYTIPSGLASGTGYKIRVASSNPIKNSGSGGLNNTIDYRPGGTFTSPVNVGTISACNTYSNTRSNATSQCYGDNYGQSSDDIYYKFTITSAATVDISHCGSGGLDTYMWLLNSSGALITSDDDNGPLCSGVSSSIVQSLSAGTYYVVSECFSSGSGNITTTIKIHGCPRMGEDIETAASPIQMSPNPASDNFNLFIPSGDVSTVQILDMQGSLKQEVKVKGEQCQIDLSNIPSGIYIVNVIQGDVETKMKLDVVK